MKVLVIGGTGNVGSQVTRGLLERGASVRLMSRHARSTAPAGVEAMAGDLEKPETVGPAFSGVDAVFLLNALSQSETAQGLTAVDAAMKAGVKRIVYMSVMMTPGSESIPHFASKIPIEQVVRESGMEWTILRPNNFHQNDVALKDGILNGVYSQPVGSRFGINRVDVRDVADAAVNAFYDRRHAGKLYPVNGPRPWTGDDTARVYSEELGRPVRYGGDDLEAWGRQMSAFLPGWLIEDLKIMYRFFQERGLLATASDLELQRQVVGHEPRTLENFVKEMAVSWKTPVGAR